MSLTFASFKKSIPSAILTKGRDYVRQGHILDLSFDEDDMLWEAQVEGTELYDVRIQQTASGSLNCACTCPYDMGAYCKHIAAVLYAIEETFPDQIAAKPRKKPAKRQTRFDQLRQRLEKSPREQLIEVMLELAQQDRELLNQLLIRLDTGDLKPTDYRRVVKDALRAGRGDYGFLDYSGSNRAGRKIDELLMQAKRWFEAGEVEKAVVVYQAVIDETVPAIAHADDSNGTLGGCISMAVEGLAESIERQTETRREALFEYALACAQDEAFRGWDWGWDLLEIASSLVNSPARRSRFTAALDAIEARIKAQDKTAFYNRYGLEQIALLNLGVIERLDGSAAARAFLQANSHLDRPRMLLIERCLRENALDEANQLIQDGIAASQRQRLPGLTHEYQALRVKLLQKKGDKAEMIEAARALWLNRGSEDQFNLLQETVPAAEWPSFVEGLIRALSNDPQQLAWLYARENRWSDLLALAQSSQQSARLLETYRQPLESRFPDAVATLYEKIADAILASASGRGHYQRATAYLQRISKLGQSERVSAIVDRLRKQYPNRPALLDELKRL